MENLSLENFSELRKNPASFIGRIFCIHSLSEDFIQGAKLAPMPDQNIPIPQSNWYSQLIENEIHQIAKPSRVKVFCVEQEQLDIYGDELMDLYLPKGIVLVKNSPDL